MFAIWLQDRDGRLEQQGGNPKLDEVMHKHLIGDHRACAAQHIRPAYRQSVVPGMPCLGCRD
jgi:hypothetical protein